MEFIMMPISIAYAISGMTIISMIGVVVIEKVKIILSKRRI